MQTTIKCKCGVEFMSRKQLGAHIKAKKKPDPKHTAAPKEHRRRFECKPQASEE